MAQFRVARMGDASAAAGTAKTMARVLAGANKQVKIRGWGISGDSVSASDKPIKAQLRYETTTSAPTGTSVTPSLDQGGGSCEATCLVNCSAEGTPTYDTNDFESDMVPATSGYAVWYPLGQEKTVDINKAVRLLATVPTTAINYAYWIVFSEE